MLPDTTMSFLVLVVLIISLNLIPTSCAPSVSGVIKGPRPDSWIETFSWKPRAFVYHGFLTDSEADHIRKLAEPNIERSSVFSYDETESEIDDIRTSYGTFLEHGQDEVVKNIEDRVAQWARVPVRNFESMQVLRYQFNQTYGAHWDELDPIDAKKTVGDGSPRLATVLMYLTDIKSGSGGETAFPHSLWIDKDIQAAGTRFNQNCTNGNVAVQPVKGDAILFFGLKIDLGRVEPFSLHAGCPVLEGEKWTAVFWIHTKSFRYFTEDELEESENVQLARGNLEDQDLLQNGDDLIQNLPLKRGAAPIAHPCVDRNTLCKSWAAAGECEKNPEFMLGTDTNAGICVKSCGFCCPPADVLCERKLSGRRRRLGLTSPHSQ